MSAHVMPVHLAQGSHNDPGDGLCVLEAVAYAAGEPHSDAPSCASPVLRQFMITLNDRLDDERRQLLRPFILRTIGTAGDGRDEERREMCGRWLADRLPDLFEQAGLSEHAVQLREMLPRSLSDGAVLRVLRAARSDAWVARSEAYDTLRVRVREELAKQNIDWSKFDADDKLALPAAVVAESVVAESVVAVAEAVVAVVAEAVVAVAAVAVAVVAAAAVAVAVAVAAVTVAVVAAAAVAVAVAAAAEAEAVTVAVAVAAEAGASGSVRYWAVRDAVRNTIYPAVLERAREILDPDDERLNSALDLLDRMLPETPIQPPARDDAELLFPMEPVA